MAKLYWLLSRQSREIKKAEQERVAQQVLGTKLTFGNYNRECRTILSDARRIIADRRASDELAREEKKNEDLLQQIFEEQKNLKQLVLKQTEELAELKKKIRWNIQRILQRYLFKAL